MSQPTKTPLQWIDAIWMSGARWNEVHLARVRLDNIEKLFKCFNLMYFFFLITYG